jgi:hypothetical protein
MPEVKRSTILAAFGQMWWFSATLPLVFTTMNVGAFNGSRHDLVSLIGEIEISN